VLKAGQCVRAAAHPDHCVIVREEGCDKFFLAEGRGWVSVPIDRDNIRF